MQEPTATPSFFIANKLRGIPLVTEARDRHQPQRRRNDRLQDTTTTTTSTPPPKIQPSSQPARARTSNSTSRKPVPRTSLASVVIKPVVQQQPSNKPVSVLESTKPTSGRLGKLLRTVALEPTRRPIENVAVDLQRRASNSVLSTRFTTSKPGADKANSNGAQQVSSGGKNWHLFNSSDGRATMAPFEIFALAANLLIAGTVILVILMNWVKLLRGRKQKQTSAKQVPNASKQESTTTPIVVKPSAKNGQSSINDKPKQPQPLTGSTSGLSMYPVSSVTPSMSESRLSGSGVSPLIPKSATMSPLVKDVATIVAPDTDKQSVKGSGSNEQPKNTSSNPSKNLESLPKELPGHGAMAIKQPADTVTSMKKELEQVKELGLKVASVVTGAIDSAGTNKESVKETPLLDGAVELVRPVSEPAKLGVPVQVEPTAPPPGDGRQSVGSLESVELPAALVGSGNKSGNEPSQKEDPTNPVHRENLLLTLKQAEVEGGNELRQQLCEAEASQGNRPENPMSEHLGAPEVDTQAIIGDVAIVKRPLIVNKLDKRKTELEIVDLRDSSVAGKINGPSQGSSGEPAEEPTGTLAASHKEGWISMDEVAVVQPSVVAGEGNPSVSVGKQALTPADIIESRFKVDYKEKPSLKATNSFDSRRELEATLEADAEPESSRTKNKKYFVYIVQDGHFSARKECIAQIELPSKKRVTLAEMRTMIANSQDISLASLRRNKFKFVTETYRLLNENEDATVLHQVYPTQGVFLKLNIAEQETLGHLRTIANAPSKARGSGLLRIQPTNQTGPTSGPGTARRRSRATDASAATRATGRTRAKSSPKRADKSKSSLDSDNKTGARNSVPDVVEPEAEEPQIIGRSISRSNAGRSPAHDRGNRSNSRNSVNSIGANMMHGAKRLFDATFNRQSQGNESADVAEDETLDDNK